MPSIHRSRLYAAADKLCVLNLVISGMPSILFTSSYMSTE